MRAAFTPPCSSTRSPPPTGPHAAATRLTRAVRVALAQGRRGLCVDVLDASLTAASPTFNPATACALHAGVVRAVPGEGTVRVVVPGVSDIVRVRGCIADDGIVEVLAFSSTEAPTNRGVVVLDPAAGDMREFRALLKTCGAAGVPVVVCNHPRTDAVYRAAGFGGDVPWELWRFEPVFVCAPFAVRGKGEERSERFVLMREFPGAWCLWRRTSGGKASFLVEDAQYTFCAEFDKRPSDSVLFDAVAKSVRRV